MAKYWKSPYNNLNVPYNRQEKSLLALAGNADNKKSNGSETLARYHWLDLGLPKGVQRTSSTASAAFRRDCVKPKSILKIQSEIDMYDEQKSLFSISDISNFRSSAHSQKDKKKVTFEIGTEKRPSSEHQTLSHATGDQPRLRLNLESMNSDSEGMLKKLFGEYHVKSTATIKGKLTLRSSSSAGLLNTNGKCRHSVNLKCSFCLKHEDIDSKETKDEMTDTSESNGEEVSCENSQTSKVWLAADQVYQRIYKNIISNIAENETAFNDRKCFLKPWSKTLVYLPIRNMSLTNRKK